MTKHTPGPWIADLYEDGCFVVRPHGKEGPLIAERGVWFDDESHANARLIAAAPDLLVALRNLLDHTCGTDSFCEWCARHAPKDQGGSIVGPIPHVSDCLWLAAERAIAKAEGRG